MSAEDRCAYRYSFTSTCRVLRAEHPLHEARFESRHRHVFVEPAPQPEPLFDTSAPPKLHAGFALCADVNCPDASLTGIRHAHGPGGRVQVLRDPPAQPAPSGDEAKVREIVEAHGGVYSPSSSMTKVAVEAYAAGKADGAREEREACEKVARDEADQSVTAEEIADAIARRGSEGT